MIVEPVKAKSKQITLTCNDSKLVLLDGPMVPPRVLGDLVPTRMPSRGVVLIQKRRIGFRCEALDPLDHTIN
jgi:hypothetical protein